ncbi:MAG: PQQ-binding-like beta-propeller repeat protein [Verrucomicrobiae bacterium]|nr:PQQ-binding-like beta-propeller repeat protein [Verrucomicrobiae bacterium]
MRKFFFSIKRVLSTFRRTTAIAAGIALTLVCWIAFDQPPGTKIWDFYTGKAIQSSAAIGHNGMVYFGTDGGKVYAFYPDGRGQWEFPTGDRIVASPAVGSDGTIYIGGYDGILYAIAPEGIERWRFRANGPISSSAAIGPDGTICFGTLNNRLFALRPDGSKIWDLAASEPVVGSPAIGANGILYAPSSDGVLAAIRLATGDVLWEFEAPNRILSSPAIAADGTLYFGCFDGHLYALDRYGKKKWTFATGGPIRGSASVGPDGTVYVGSDDRQLYALAPDGFKKWTFTAGKWIRATPAIAADGTVYIGSYDHSLYAVSPTGAKKWEYVTDHNVTASAAISRDGTVFFGSWNGRFYAIRGGAALAEGEWPRFRGDSQQRGSVGRITPPAPLIAETRTPEAEAEVPQTITITQEPGSVLGRWWSRLRSSSTKASTQTASAVAEARVIEANTSTTVVAAAEPALPTPNPGTMTPVWKQNDRESLAVDPSTVLDTAAAEPVRAITIRQEQGSVLGRWWRGLSKKKESPEPGSASAMATSSEPDATSVTTTLVTAAGTNDLDAEREAAYRARTTAMESRISTLESELATKRQNEAKVIADSDNLISGAETVVTTTTVTAPTSVRTRSVSLQRELVNESTTATQTARPGMLPMMRLISVDPPSKAEVKKPETPRLQHPSEIPPESPAPKLENQMDLRSRLNVLPGEVDLNGEQEIAAAWGESPDEAPRQSSWWSRVFGSSEKAPKQEVAESPAPVAPTSIQSNGREAAYENRIISLEQHIAELNARLAQQQSDNATAPTTLTFAGPTKQVTSETGLSVNVAPVVSETVTAQPEIVTAREREYRAGLFQRMFSKNEAPVRSVAVEETTATINAGEVVESSAVRVISDSATLVSPETTTETTKVTRVVEAEPVQPEVVTAKEREYRAGLFQRMFSKNEAPVRSVAVEETTATINAGEVVESSAVRVISDSATLVSPETTTETTKVTRVVEAEPVQPEVVTAKERENRPGFFKRLFSGKDGDSAVRVVSVSRTSETSPEDSGAATVENLSSKDSYSETPATVEPKVTPPKPSGPFDAKLAKLEGLMGDMQEELEATRQERDELKRQIGGSLAESIVAVPAPTSKATTAERKLDPDSAAEADYGDKISKLESQLVSLSEELGNARVERARMREELATARRAPAVRPTVVDSVPVSPVLPETTTVIADSANLVTGDGAEIPQPEWLKREVRSVIATADPWTQPPGTAAATIAVAPTELAASESTVTESKISGAVDLVELPAAEETTRVEEKVIRRKPGFFGRLFGLGESVEERRYASTNVVVTPPAVNVSAVATSQPSDSQLLGNDTGFGSGAAQTNFPRVAYSPEAGTSFFTPGAGNLTQLPGFPRPQPALIAPPAREMDPTRISSGEGLKSVAVRESVPVVPVSEAGVTTVGSLSVDRPVVAIMSPPDGSELAGRVLDLRGLAQGERRIAQVLVSLDGGPFTPAAGLERWSFQSPVPTGQVLVRVKAMDATGRESEIVSRTYGHTANARLNVEVIGNGTVSPDLNARELQIGTPYEIVARPAPGNEFVGWSGGVTGSNPKLVFQMNSGLFLRAEFRPIGRELSLRGSYTGLLYPGELMQADRSGYFELNIERDGTFGGEIRLATSAAPLRGRFDTSGQATQTIERPGAAPITIRFMLQNEGAEVVGTFDADGVGIVMRGFRSVPDGDTLAAITPGRYTLVIPGPPDAADSGTPAGDGFGEVQIDAGGHVKFTGELPDGTVVKQETRISSGGVWPVYVPLYGGAGMLTGWISVTNHPSLDLHGDLRWIKPPTPSDRYYPGGFAARRFVFGSIYKPSHDNLDKRKGLAGVLLGGNLGRVVLGQDVATMPLTSPQRETLQQFKYQVDQNSGRVEGSFLHPETKQPTAFRGVLVQKRGWKSGYFMGADASGVVYLNGQ